MARFGKVFDEMKKIKGYPLLEVTSMKLMGQAVESTREVTEMRKGAIRLHLRNPGGLQEEGLPSKPGEGPRFHRRAGPTRGAWTPGRGRPLVPGPGPWAGSPIRRATFPGPCFDLDADLSGPGGGRGRPDGRHPWPSEEQVARVMGAAGIGPETQVVAYDDQAGAIAARFWYVLKAHGHDAVAVLDGGLAKWLAEGRPLSTLAPRPAARGFAARLLPGFVATKAELASLDPQRLLLDARAPERYRGEPSRWTPGRPYPRLNAPYAQPTDGPVPGSHSRGAFVTVMRSWGAGAVATAAPGSPPATTCWPCAWPALAAGCTRLERVEPILTALRALDGRRLSSSISRPRYWP